jgi:hypothetical protein
VALNLGSEPGALEMENFAGTALLSTYCDRTGEHCQGKIDLRPDEGLVLLETVR